MDRCHPYQIKGRKENEENRNGTRKPPLMSKREYSSLRYHTALFMTV
ncbi:hypothetical protein SEEGA711_08912 [Salmonella enterica subsp. enterica serovar Gaminara str. ATCC BAA-711]|nr:hypothetical protein SEEGA711_08912 [Salmonella enterica subsp. enterica serovar Gaminara str. ATCC BAA-711]